MNPMSSARMKTILGRAGGSARCSHLNRASEDRDQDQGQCQGQGLEFSHAHSLPMSDYRLAEDRRQVSRRVNMAADGSNHGGQCGIIGNPQGCGFAGVANGGRVAVAEVSTDGGEAEAGMLTGQVHGQVAGLHDGGLPARAAQGRPPHAELGTDNPGDLLDREPGDGECVILGQDRSHGGKIKRWRVARSRRFQAWTRSPASRPRPVRTSRARRASQPFRVR